ncbi:MAG: HD domain-containing protein [Sulfurimonas sp.]|nr:HD domain-containing protein [Sulfurimonas sp.]
MQSINLQECEKEPIHIPGFIQPYGIAISYNKTSNLITGASDNFENAAAFIGTSLSMNLHSELLLKMAQLNTDAKQQIFYNIQPFSLDSTLYNAKNYNVIWSNSQEEGILEFLAFKQDPIKENNNFLIAESFERILIHRQIEEICLQGALEIQKNTGFDRVMVYQFDASYNGCVIAETKHEGMIPYLNLNFPSSDIPPQARELYKKQTVRVISDISYTPIGFLRDASLQPLDMTYSYLRSVSPIHLEYLKNMSVGATLTISIIIDDKLWGLIACHHRKKHVISLEQLDFSRAFGVLFSGVLKARIDGFYKSRNVHLLSTLETIINGLRLEDLGNKNIFDVLSQNGVLFRTLFQSNNFSLIIKNEVYITKKDCEKTNILKLLSLVSPKMRNNLFYTSNLKNEFPELEEKILTECSGILCIKITGDFESFWIWTRKEKPQTLTWGGDPQNKVIIKADGKISPRASFAAFKEIVKYQSDHWHQADIDFAPHFISSIKNLYKALTSQTQVTLTQKKIRAMEDEKTLHYGELLESLVNLIEKRDAYTAGHTARVANYCSIIADEMNLTKLDKEQLYEAAILHDIGKIVVPDAILLKPGKLSQAEYALIKTHLNAGYEILKRISYYAPLAEIMLYHHEKYNGSGYPKGVKGDEIPLTAHIMIVADSIDAMTSNRIYQSRKTIEEAIDEIVLYRGIWYHPAVVDACVRIIKSFKINTHVSQIPSTNTEKARFSYYFQDQLTGLYNESYLKMITDNLIQNVFYPYFLLIEIEEMSLYNKEHGWHAGNVYIQDISNKLQNIFPNEHIFRIFGDDFVIGCTSVQIAAKFQETLLSNKISAISIKQLNIHETIKMLLE